MEKDLPPVAAAERCTETEMATGLDTNSGRRIGASKVRSVMSGRTVALLFFFPVIGHSEDRAILNKHCLIK